MAGPGKQAAYKRSWKNLLLNKRYQLRFTLTMVGLSAALMGLLGWWVMRVANRSTLVAINNVQGEEICHDPLADMPDDEGAALPADDGAGALPPDDGAGAVPPDDGAVPPDDGAGAKPEGKKPVVTLEESSMELVPEAGAGTKPPDPEAVPETAPTPETAPAPAEAPAGNIGGLSIEECKARQLAKINDLDRRNWLIFWVLVVTGAMLVFGLLVYGIKMTHKVAGPLHKVSLYMAKLQEGRYDTVYNLRKGDQLVSFYEHFKAAHAGMKRWQVDDVARLKTLIAAADQAKLAGRSPEAAEALEELRALLEKKEKSLS